MHPRRLRCRTLFAPVFVRFIRIRRISPGNPTIAKPFRTARTVGIITCDVIGRPNGKCELGWRDAAE